MGEAGESGPNIGGGVYASSRVCGCMMIVWPVRLEALRDPTMMSATALQISRRNVVEVTIRPVKP